MSAAVVWMLSGAMVLLAVVLGIVAFAGAMLWRALVREFGHVAPEKSGAGPHADAEEESALTPTLSRPRERGNWGRQP